MAEGAFFVHAADRTASRRFMVASAGTCGNQKGAPPDPRAVSAAAGFGIDIASLRARCVDDFDLASFDRIFVMDYKNYEDVVGLTDRAERVRLVMSFVPGRVHEEVLDPYYGSELSFRRVMADLFLACGYIFDALADRYPDSGVQ